MRQSIAAHITARRHRYIEQPAINCEACGLRCDQRRCAVYVDNPVLIYPGCHRHNKASFVRRIDLSTGNEIHSRAAARRVADADPTPHIEIIIPINRQITRAQQQFPDVKLRRSSKDDPAGAVEEDAIAAAHIVDRAVKLDRAGGVCWHDAVEDEEIAAAGNARAFDIVGGCACVLKVDRAGAADVSRCPVDDGAGRIDRDIVHTRGAVDRDAA